MGLFYSAAEKSTLEDLLRWVEKNKDYDDQGNTIIDYDNLVEEIKKRILEADYD